MTQLIRINGQRVHGGVTVRIGVQRDNDVRRIVFQSVPTIGGRPNCIPALGDG